MSKDKMENSSTDDSTSSPSHTNSELADYDLDPLDWNLESLRHAALHHRLVRPHGLAWAILLYAVPYSQGDIIESLNNHRKFYNDLRTKLSADPRAVVDDDPLSQSDESVWKQHFCDNELKALILQDVVRTSPDELYFRDKDVQDIMVRILFFWARSHSYLGYRQGMHEILAPILFELFQDRRFAPNKLSEILKCVLDEDYLEHDSYMLFSTIMKGIERFYTTGDAVPSSCGRLPTSKSAHKPNEVIRYLEQLRNEYLVPLDQELAAHLSSCNITMELFGIRWLRLLFGREFPRAELPGLWGFLFADGPSLPHLHYVILAMLISIRDKLVDAEAGAVLSWLMRACPLPARHIVALALHLRAPLRHTRPPAPKLRDIFNSVQSVSESSWSLEQCPGAELECDSGSEGVAEGGDVARELAALALLRARLPPAAARLAAALPRPPRAAAQPLRQILQLAALLQCRNHALVDVETALEAAEGQSTEQVGRRQVIPVAIVPKRPPNRLPSKLNPKVKEVPLKVFHHAECKSASDLPFLDPLRLRTE